ncbi:Mitochodrial transcription termination factor-related [Cinnamomum micranthum f. kanehirae]|uniref:Mitochodrial transcription termination factor-related n=1 Tax=Cinnamomum micranthum f. kanehirae TaxID=337451 RepID=A0A3S3MSA7_9MAGN|nr:Mitochodrial transcription termination factor-related [Cinnamomum micranthum f. kanehirae]
MTKREDASVFLLPFTRVEVSEIQYPFQASDFIFSPAMYSCISHHCVFLRRSAASRDFTNFRTLLLFSTTIGENPLPQTHFMVDYLVERCGFSRENAINASTSLTRLKSPENPDSVLGFLKKSGFEDTHIKKLISSWPRFLASNVEKTLKPKFIFFQELGLSGASFADLVAKCPALLHCSMDNHIRPQIDFLRTLLQNDDDVIRVIKRGHRVCRCNLHEIIMPNIEILRRYGASDRQISSCLVLHTEMFALNPDFLEDVAGRVEKLGFKRGSPMFFCATYVLSSLSQATIEAKVKMLKSFGWSEEDVFSAFLKAPLFLAVSERKFRAFMRFFLDVLGCEPSKLRSRPVLFMYSLEKRLLPRHEVLKFLKSKGLLEEGVNFLSVAQMSESLFLKKFVLRYLDDVPDLKETYKGCMKIEKSR